MKKKKWMEGSLGAITVVMLMLMACAPQATPAPPIPAVSMPPPGAVAVPKAVPVVSPEQAAWDKVVESAKKDGKLVVYSFYMIGETGIRMREGFKKNTGLDVEFITGTGAPLIERIKAERRAGFQVASVLDTGTPLLIQAKQEGLTEATGPLPSLQEKGVWREQPILDREGHILTSSVTFQSPWINTRLVKSGDEPKSWRDLLQPRWKGKISIGDPDTTPATVSVYYMLVRKHGILNNVYFRELGKTAAFAPNARLNADAIIRGDAEISLANTASVIAPYLQEGAPVKAIDMDEGVIGKRSMVVSLLSKAPHPNVARVFINWWFSREGQYTYYEAYGSESLRTDVPNFLHPAGRLTPKRVLWANVEDEIETAVMQQDRVVKRVFLGQ